MWTIFVVFINEDNLFRIIMIEALLPTTGSYSGLGVPDCDFTPPMLRFYQTSVI